MAWKHRYVVLIILFLIYLLCYLDRMVMATAIPFIADEFHLSPLAMGGVLSAFFLSYSICQIPGGLLADKFGANRMITAGVACWSVFTALTGAVGSLSAMLVVRLLFGIGEGVFPPAAFKTIASWFPKREVGRANGFMLTTNSLGPALAPLFVSAVVIHWGWRVVFYSLFIPGLIAAAFAWIYIKDSPRESKRMYAKELAEYDDVAAQTTVAKAGLFQLLKMPVVSWCFAALFLTNMAGWGIAAWLPTYLLKARGFSVAKMGIYASLPFFGGTIGYYLGGYLIDTKLLRERKHLVIIVGITIAAIFTYCAAIAPTGEWAILFLTVVYVCKQSGTSGIFTFPVATLPREVVGVAMGIVNTGGQAAGFISPLLVGYILTVTHGNYELVFYFFVACLAFAALSATRLTRGGQRRKQASQTA
jgi:sugar phosphate permease